MTRTQKLEIICQELERDEGLPPEHIKRIAELRLGIVGQSFESVLRAIQRIEDGARE